MDSGTPDDTKRMITQAKELLQRIGGKKLQRDARIEMAISLAALMLEASKQHISPKEKRRAALFSRLVQDTKSKTFITAVTDSCFRTKDPKRIIAHLKQLIQAYGIPSFLTPLQHFAFKLFYKVGPLFPKLCTNLLQFLLRKEMGEVILPGEEQELQKYLKKRKEEYIQVNLNRLGEAILGEEEAEKRLQMCLTDIKNPLIPVISVKISSIFSQITLVAEMWTKDALKEKFRILYRACQKETPCKFVNLDMEEYRDLHLTADVFKEILDETEFFHFSAGIALQSYIPDSFEIQKSLTEWAMKRVAKGGAPIRIRIVKGANFGMEHVESSLKGWPQATYEEKIETDANFKRMVEYGIEHIACCHLGIASHNLFDIAYGLLLRAEYSQEKQISFELLEGMANHIRKVVQELSQNVLLYCPAARKEEFHTAMAYLMRRLDENTHKDNFLPYLFDMTIESEAWAQQTAIFKKSFTISPSSHAKRMQNRFHTPKATIGAFINEPDTDWSIAHNQKWAESIIQEKCFIKSYPKATEQEIEKIIQKAKTNEWQILPISEKVTRFKKLASLLRLHRRDLIGAMVAEVHKIIPEADSEVSEAIDMIEYYTTVLEKFQVSVAPESICLVATPWNFPCAIPTGGIVAALASGYSVIFKPAPEAVHTGALLTEFFIQANIPLHFVSCEDDPVGASLIQHPLLKTVLLTGSTATARKFLQLSPTLRLFAETGGKNSIIVTRLADRDLAVRDIVQSSFGYAGQKCSACSLVICEEEVYNDPHFRMQLLDAAKSLYVGEATNLATKINPLINDPSPHLLQALTTLEPHESWLLQPEVNPHNPRLWSPGIKLGVQKGSFTHQTEFFGPVIGLMCAKNLEEAISIANDTPYGLTAGLHSLDIEEHAFWIDRIQAGNLYINRGITGAIVARQPFGGCKTSSFGIGMKAGYENYLLQLYQDASAGEDSYQYFWDTYFSSNHLLTHLTGEDNILFFRGHPKIFVYVEKNEDTTLLEKAAHITNTELIISGKTLSLDEFMKAIEDEPGCRIRCLQTPPKSYAEKWIKHCICLDIAPSSPNGRIELLHFVREVSLSYTYHRYGNVMGK
ncbi:MAG: hypothetical protein JWO53_1038 [Chlamydiia bacterium]|nr:hypothetical protein [Chlamydiia bacterium]